jgi:hypothetical protein
MPLLLHYPVSAGARPCPGRSSSGLTALRGLHLDTACAPAFTWQLTRSRDNQDQPIEVSTLSGVPQPVITGPWVPPIMRDALNYRL